MTLAGALVAGVDPLHVFSELTADCARMLDVAAAGLLLADRQGVLRLAAASSEGLRVLEVFQLQAKQGPCLDCYRRGRPVTVTNLFDDAAKWPQFAESALTAGFASVHALPMRLRDKTVGALGLFGTSTGALNPRDLQLGQAFADVATISIIQDMASADSDALARQLQKALDSRVVIEQAKGVLSEHGSLDMDDAFNVLRRYCRDHNLRLTDTATALVTRKLTPDDVLTHFTKKEQPQAR